MVMCIVNIIDMFVFQGAVTDFHDCQRDIIQFHNALAQNTKHCFIIFNNMNCSHLN